MNVDDDFCVRDVANQIVVRISCTPSAPGLLPEGLVRNRARVGHRGLLPGDPRTNEKLSIKPRHKPVSTLAPTGKIMFVASSGSLLCPGPASSAKRKNCSGDVSSLSRVTFALFVVANSVRENPGKKALSRVPSGY